ncbi:hypothetical protein ACQP1P_14585 [Dactylosporangium sp. CA-052675]|uniref:hypothetical protein n=1 Tax=Dactylosporangium sp. CA-052675 TaxID=3239927 RepID=UPI003D8D0504
MISVLTLPIERCRVMAHLDGDIVAPGDGGIDVFETLLPVSRFLAGLARSSQFPRSNCRCTDCRNPLSTTGRGVAAGAQVEADERMPFAVHPHTIHR